MTIEPNDNFPRYEREKSFKSNSQSRILIKNIKEKILARKHQEGAVQTKLQRLITDKIEEDKKAELAAAESP
jgi:hypothetical protein